ncbi:MAG: exodeoxyribonuclease VII large subunit [Bacteroidales bacterium]|nr:exodeoxyribonuclease VII large subunit [Bacteroidales bacterium]
MMEETVYTLQQLLSEVKGAVDSAFPVAVWVKGEIQGLSVNRSGHCYMSLIEKNVLTGALLAEVRAIIWSSRYRTLATRFTEETGRGIEDGMSILALATVQYSELYGLSLIIEDIDSAFTAGEAFLQRQRTINRLTQEGMMDLNARVPMRPLPRRLAVISASTAAGYGDFMEHLHNNPYGFKFVSELFPAPMQGVEAPAGIIAALEAVAARQDEFDAVLMLRGGGSATDLACFDDYDLALNIAQFPLPVLTAIGHERDVHVADMVAFEHLKTPTALADYFVDIFAQEDYALQTLAGRLSLAVRTKAAGQRQRLDALTARIRGAVSLLVQQQRSKVQMLEYKVGALNPASILAKGFSLTLKDGRRVTSAKSLKAGDDISIVLSDGNVKGKVQ